MSKTYPLASTTWDESEISAMHRVIQSGNFTMGKEVAKFENDFAHFFGSKYAVMSNSGSSANLLAMAAMRYSKKYDFQNRDEVLVPAVSWSTTYYPISQLGFKIKFVDVDLKTLNIDLNKVKDSISERTAGIFAVNLLGNPADLVGLKNLASENGIFLLEDNCESMGAKVKDKFAGSFGDIGTFSCFFSHHISTMEGGVCITDDLELAQVMTSMRAHGWTRELPSKNFVFDKTGEPFDDLFRFILPGYNLRPLELSGAIGQEQLNKLPDLIQGRINNAEIFFEEFKNSENLILQSENGSSSWFGFSMILNGKLSGRRSDVVKVLLENGVECRPIVAGNFAKNPVLKYLNHCEIPDLASADRINEDGLFVGNHHYDLSDQIKYLASLIGQI